MARDVSTREDLVELGYDIPAAEPGSWRDFDKANPVPGYFEFDWLSARYPDLYHTYAISTEGLMDALEQLVDLSGLVVADIGAGTGRATMRIARKAKKVYAIDAYRSVVEFGIRQAEAAQFTNIEYLRGDRSRLPLDDASVHAVTCAWAELDYSEAKRVLKNRDYVIHMGSVPGLLCGEMTPALQLQFPHLITEVADLDLLHPDYPPKDYQVGATRIHEFTYISRYDSADELAAMVGRLYGPVAEKYVRDRNRPTLAWRLQIKYEQVAKLWTG